MKLIAGLMLILVLLCVSGVIKSTGYKMGQSYCTELFAEGHGVLLCIN